jgi:hypothetical protein
MKSNCFIHLEQNLLESVVQEVESADGKIGHLTTRISIVSFRFPILHSLPHLTDPYQHENAIDE